MDLEQDQISTTEFDNSEASNIEFVDSSQQAPAPQKTEEPAPAKEPSAKPPSKLDQLKAKAEGKPVAGKPTPQSQAAPQTATPPAQPAWVPDYKFKVMDKEHEIDPIFHAIIKDEETLKKVKRLHEQALGIPHLEQSRDEFKNKYNQAAPRLEEYSRVEKSLDRLSHFVQKEDFTSFFNEARIPIPKVLKWVKTLIDAQDNPALAGQLQEKSQYNQQMYDLQTKNQQYEAQQQEYAQAQALMQIDQAIGASASPEAQFYNERMQNPTAFRDLVIMRGQQYQMQTGQRAPISQIIESVKMEFQRLGVVPNAQNQQQTSQAPAGQPQQAPAPGTVNVVPATSKPTIPSVKAGGQSPVVTPVRSMKDLKARAAAL